MSWMWDHLLSADADSEERWLAPMINPNLCLLGYLIFTLKDVRLYLQTFPKFYTYNSSSDALQRSPVKLGPSLLVIHGLVLEPGLARRSGDLEMCHEIRSPSEARD